MDSNKYGGSENIEAIDFLRKFNDAIHEHFPGIITFAEESTSWAVFLDQQRQVD